MKLRVRHNSIRFRLGRTEVERLWQGLECRERICFPGNQQLEYVIQPSSSSTITALLLGQIISVEIPRHDLAEWCASERVGLCAEIAVPHHAPLQVLIERDFRCLDPAISEDQSDTFDNPLERHSGDAIHGGGCEY